MSSTLQRLRAPIVAQRVRRIAGQGFGFIPHRFMRDGFLTSLGRDQLALYVFLVLAANRDGVSFYGFDAICSALHLPLERYIEARNSLIAKDLVAFDGTRFQVLSLPESPVESDRESKPLVSEADFKEHDPATIRAIILDQFGSDDDGS